MKEIKTGCKYAVGATFGCFSTLVFMSVMGKFVQLILMGIVAVWGAL